MRKYLNPNRRFFLAFWPQQFRYSFTSQWFLLRDTIIAEEKSTTRDVTRLKAALDDEIAVMDATVGERSQRSEPGVGGEDDHRAVGSGDSLPPSRRFAGAGMKL